MQKPTPENKQLQSDIEALYSCLKTDSLSPDEFTTYVYNLLLKTYELCTYIDEKFILKESVVRFEKDRSTIDSFIEKYTVLSDKALDNEDENLHWRYTITVEALKMFKKNPDKTLAFLRASISSNLLLNQEEFFESYTKMLTLNDPKRMFALLKNYHNQDLFIELYGLFEGYQISQQKLLKSSALKLFNYCILCSNVKKNLLAQKIEFIFATLSETLTIDAKRASQVRVISEFKGMSLIDYESNKRTTLDDFGLSDVISHTLKSIITLLKQTGQKEMISQININLKTLEPHFINKLLS